MENVFVRIVDMAITAGWLVLVVLLLRLFLRRTPKWITCLLWGMVAFRLICPVRMTSSVSLVPQVGFAKGNVASRDTESTAPVATADIPGGNGSSVIPAMGSGENGDRFAADGTMNQQVTASAPWDRVETEVEEGRPEQQEHGSRKESDGAALQNDRTQKRQLLWKIAGVVWITGAVLMLALAVVSYIRLRYRLREAVPVQDDIWVCDHVDSPFILGVIRPRIYLPSGMPQDVNIDMVIAHEQAHLKRLDHLWKPLGYLLLGIYWFQPLLWVAFRFFCTDIELACDESVIRTLSGDGKKEYCSALLHCSVQRRTIYSCPLAFGEVGVKERMKNIFRYKKPEFWALVVALITCVIVAVCFLTDRKSGKKEVTPGGVDIQDTADGQGEDTVPDEAREEHTESTEKNGYVVNAETGRYELGDLDGDGIGEYILLTEWTEHNDGSSLSVYWNDRLVYSYDDILRISGLYEVRYIDLDRDGAEELYCSFFPVVNSMPLMEYFVLDYENGTWRMQEMYHDGDLCNNSFPITVTMGQEAPIALIGCEGYEDTISFDLKKHIADLCRSECGISGTLTDMYAGMVYRYAQMFEQNWQAGQACGEPLAWGIWDMQVKEYDGHPCLVATQEIAGEDGKYDCYGELDLYFDYDEEGKIRILNLEFEDGYAGTTMDGEHVFTGTTPYDAYASVAELYFRAGDLQQKLRDIEYVEIATGNLPIQTEYLIAVQDPEATPIFLLYDLNEDGTDELFIGIRFTWNEPIDYIIYDVYTWQDGRAYRLMDHIGYRNGSCEISSGGVIVDRSSGSAWDSGTIIWTLPENGTALERLDSYSSVGVDKNGSRVTEWYHRDQKITQQGYIDAMSQYPYLLIGTWTNNPENIDCLRKGMIYGGSPRQIIKR